jgi:hypothetical protein
MTRQDLEESVTRCLRALGEDECCKAVTSALLSGQGVLLIYSAPMLGITFIPRKDLLIEPQETVQ